MLFNLKFPRSSCGAREQARLSWLSHSPPSTRNSHDLGVQEMALFPPLMQGIPYPSSPHLCLLLPRHSCMPGHASPPGPFRCPQPSSSCSLPSAPLQNRFPGGEEEEEEDVLAVGGLARHVKAKQTSCGSSRRRRETEVPAVSQCCIFSSAASHSHGWSCHWDAASQPA